MLQRSLRRRTQGGARLGPKVREAKSLVRFLRDCHIFSSATREALEALPLREASELPLTIAQIRLLKLLVADGRHRLGAIAGFLGVSPPAATKSIDKLERLGLVVRTAAQGDRRAKLLCVSPKGRRLVQRYEERKTARLSPIVDALQPGEMQRFAELVERLALALLKTADRGRLYCLRCAAYIESGCPVSKILSACPFERDAANPKNGEASWSRRDGAAERGKVGTHHARLRPG